MEKLLSGGLQLQPRQTEIPGAPFTLIAGLFCLFGAQQFKRGGADLGALKRRELGGVVSLELKRESFSITR